MIVNNSTFNLIEKVLNVYFPLFHLTDTSEMPYTQYIYVPITADYFINSILLLQ